MRFLYPITEHFVDWCRMPAVSLGENTAVLFDDDYDIAYNLRTYQKYCAGKW